jgi:hypothetical protein
MNSMSTLRKLMITFVLTKVPRAVRWLRRSYITDYKYNTLLENLQLSWTQHNTALQIWTFHSKFIQNNKLHAKKLLEDIMTHVSSQNSVF